jgi:hypothetical protein
MAKMNFFVPQFLSCHQFYMCERPTDQLTLFSPLDPQLSHGFNHWSGPAEVKAMSAGVTMADHDDGVIGVTKLPLGDRVDLFVASCSRAIINTHINCLIPSSCSSGGYKSD